MGAARSWEINKDAAWRRGEERRGAWQERSLAGEELGRRGAWQERSLAGAGREMARRGLQAGAKKSFKRWP